MNDNQLGGRLPLLHPDELSPDQRAVYQRMSTHQVPWAARHGFRAATEDQRLIGPFNVLLHSPVTAAGFLDFEAAEDRGTSLTGRVRQVIILSVGSVWHADYEQYAHSALALDAGFSQHTVDLLRHGQTAPQLGPDEALAQRYAISLAARHRVDQATHDQAVAAFGDGGVVDMALLVGRYSAISSLLTAFEVPRPQ